MHGVEEERPEQGDSPMAARWGGSELEPARIPCMRRGTGNAQTPWGMVTSIT